MSRSIKRKLSTKIIGFSKTDVANFVKEAKGKPVDLYSVIGRLTGVKKMETQYGESVGFTGMFEAINMFSGESLNASTIYLPSVVTDYLLGAFENREEQGVIEFAVVVQASENDSPTGYEYSFKPYSDPKESDEMEHLRNLLPAPEKATKAKKDKEAA